jgi:hypothetical protein
VSIHDISVTKQDVPVALRFILVLFLHRYLLSHMCILYLFTSSLNFAAMYYRGAAAAIIVYDITRSNTFKTLKGWVDELKNQGPKDIAIAIAGNKADLADQRVRYAITFTIICLRSAAQRSANNVVCGRINLYYHREYVQIFMMYIYVR